MRLIDLINEDTIIPSLGGVTRDEVIAELVDVLVQRELLRPDQREAALDAILGREASQTTGLGGGVALPHGLCPGVEDVMAVLGVHKAGVDFAAIDGKPVHLLILLVVPPNRFQAHIRTLAGVARVLNDGRLRGEIVAAGDSTTIMDILEACEESHV